MPKLDVFFSEKMTLARWPAFFSASKNQQLWKPSPSGPGGVRPIDGQHCSSDPYSVDAERKRLEEVEGARKKALKTTFQPLWSALQNGFSTGLVTESPRKCAFNSCLGTIYSEFAQKSHPFFLRGGAGWGCGTLLAKCFVYFWPGFLTAWARDAQSQCQSDWSGSASIRPSAVHFRTRMDPWCWRSWALLFVRWDGWDMPKNA